jgi:hypothetical protein
VGEEPPEPLLKPELPPAADAWPPEPVGAPPNAARPPRLEAAPPVVDGSSVELGDEQPAATPRHAERKRAEVTKWTGRGRLVIPFVDTLVQR